MRVAILGASTKKDRYSYKAMEMLTEYEHEIFLVTPVYPEIEGKKTYSSLSELNDIHTLTMYISASNSNDLFNEIVKLKPKRVIFNPGSENEILMYRLSEAEIKVEAACTLVLLRTNQF